MTAEEYYDKKYIPDTFLSRKQVSEIMESYKNHCVNAEVWRDIPNYKGLYQVSNYGKIKSIGYGKERILKPSLSGVGYLALSLVKDKKSRTRTVHQLVAETFLNHIPNGFTMVINHINLNKADNRLGNIEIVTMRENSNHKHLPSTSEYVGVSWNKRNSKWKSTIVINNKNRHLGYFTNEYDAHLEYENNLKLLKQ